MPAPKIAIIGAGPAGCTLARLLSLSPTPIDVTVFEGEASIDYRAQGGTLDLHTGTGLAAIKEAKLWDDFIKHARYDGESMLITDSNLKVYFQNKPTKEGDSKFGGQRPEIDRSDLRRILLESIPAGTVKWGHKLRRVEAGGSALVFEHETLTGFDLVVGADGAWSKVRERLTDTRPAFSGVGAHELNIPDAASTAPEVYKAINRGSVFAHADGVRMSVQQMSDGSICIYTPRRMASADWAKNCGYDATSLETVREKMIGEGGPYADWHPVLKQAIAKAQGRCIPRSLYQLPVGTTWKHQSGVTLIGDAAHLMTPFAGEGVNNAMEDSLLLAKAIIGAAQAVQADDEKKKDLSKELDAAVEAFERAMFPRVAKVAELTDKLCKAWMFTDGVPKSVIAQTTTLHVKFHTPAILHLPAAALVHSYFFVNGLFNS